MNMYRCILNLTFKSKKYFLISQNCVYYIRENFQNLRQKCKWALWMRYLQLRACHSNKKCCSTIVAFHLHPTARVNPADQYELQLAMTDWAYFKSLHGLLLGHATVVSYPLSSVKIFYVMPYYLIPLHVSWSCRVNSTTRSTNILISFH
jgi:hypothetical protein